MVIFTFIGFIILLSLNLFDVCSTALLMTFGFYEANPVVKAFMDCFGVISGLVIIKTVALTLLLVVCILTVKKKDKLTKREKSLVISGFILMICYYSYFMYFYNYKFLISLALAQQ